MASPSYVPASDPSNTQTVAAPSLAEANKVVPQKPALTPLPPEANRTVANAITPPPTRETFLDTIKGTPEQQQPVPVQPPNPVEEKPPDPITHVASTGDMVSAGTVAATSGKLGEQAEGAGAMAPDPVAKASSTPGFWQQLLGTAKTAGRSIFELLGDFAAGYSHQQTSPTEQRLAREHDLRLQGNAQQAAKDLAGIQAGFAAQQQKIQLDYQAKIDAATLDVDKQRLIQERDLTLRQLDIQRQQVQNTYQLEYLTRSLTTGNMIAQQGSAQAALDRNAAGGP